MANTESLVFDLLVRDRASGGLSDIGKAAGAAGRDTDALTRRLEELSRKSVEARVKLAGDKEAQASLDKMDARLISLDRRVASPNMKVEGAARAVAEISAVELEMDKLGGQGGTAEKATMSLGSLSGPSGMGALIAGGVALAPVVATLGLGLGGLGLAALSASKDTAAMHDVLMPLRAELGQFDAALKPEVLGLFGQGAGIATAALKELEPVAAATGKGLQGVLSQVGTELQSGQWKDFFTWMAAQAGPDLQLVGKVLVDLLNDLPPLLTQLQPAARLILLIGDAALKAFGGLEKMHLVLPLLGAAIGFMVGGPLGALIGGLAGVAVQAAAADTAIDHTRLSLEQLGRVQMPSRAAVAVDWGTVAAGLSSTAVSATDVKNAMIDAHPVVGTLRGDMDLLNIATTNADTALKAYSDLWNLLVGNAVSDQQAVLNVTQAFENFNKTVQQSGRTSTAAQQAFLSIFTAIGSGLDALHKNGASVSQLNSFYATSIDRLGKLHGLTPAQRADVQGLTKDYLAWASSVRGLSGNVVIAAAGIRNTMLFQLGAAHRLVPQVKADTDAFAAAILKTGADSRATTADRARLIRDLENSGLSAAQARQAVIQFQAQVSALHGKSVNVDLTTTGHGQIIITGTGINQRQINTATGVLRGPGGHAARGLYVASGTPGVDDQLIAAQRGELIVPTAMVRAGEVDHLRGRIPGFAAGGVVGKVTGAEGAVGLAEAQWGQLAAQAFAQAAVKASQAALASTGFLGPGGASYAADIQAVLRAMGLPLSLTANWLSQIQTESGGNLNAVNLTDSNAQAGHPSVGLLQLIPSTFAAYAGPYRSTPPLVNYGGGPVSLNAMAQIYAGIHYANARYDGSMAAVIGHGHGYDQGGYLPTGLSLAYNGTGRPEPVGPAAGGNTYVINVHASPLASPADCGRAVVGAIRAFEKRSGSGWRS